MSLLEDQYIALLNKVMISGERRGDRTGTGTLSLFAERAEYDLRLGFPLLTSKKVYFKGVVHELLWFLKGSTNVKYLQDNGVRIWDEWADETGELGPVYGKQWRDWSGKDQIEDLIKSLKEDPYSRRHIVSAWNVGELGEMALPPCHLLFQCYVDNRTKSLSFQLYQRSADLFLGVPFNIASYALLCHILCALTGYTPGRLVHVIGDAHIYVNHLDQVRLQLKRYRDEPRPMPTLSVSPISSIDEITYDHIKLNGYDPHPAIKGEVSV